MLPKFFVYIFLKMDFDSVIHKLECANMQQFDT